MFQNYQFHLNLYELQSNIIFTQSKRKLANHFILMMFKFFCKKLLFIILLFKKAQFMNCLLNNLIFQLLITSQLRDILNLLIHLDNHKLLILFRYSILLLLLIILLSFTTHFNFKHRILYKRQNHQSH